MKSILLLAVLISIYSGNLVAQCDFSKNSIDDMTGDTVRVMKKQILRNHTKATGANILGVSAFRVNSVYGLRVTTNLHSKVYSVDEDHIVIIKFKDNTTIELQNTKYSISDNWHFNNNPNQQFCEMSLEVDDNYIPLILSKPIVKIRTYNSNGYIDFDIKRKKKQNALISMFECLRV